MFSKAIAYILVGLLRLAAADDVGRSDCIADETINAEFASVNETSYTVASGSCCQSQICGLPCPEEVSPPDKVFGIVVMSFVALCVAAGFATVFFIKGKAENYFVAGRTLPLGVIVATLASQSLDSNAVLGNVDLSYKYHMFDGACLPIGLGLSLLLNSVFFAGKINSDGALTLPDVFAKRYGKIVEVMVSLCTITSFICLLAGNLVGMGAILDYLLDIGQDNAIWLSAGLVLLYTIAGGLFSVAYTDVLQASVGWVGLLATAFYLIDHAEDKAPPPSIGFENYSYPNEEISAMYDGVPCNYQTGFDCYNTEKWCPDESNCLADNGAYPIGDQKIFHNQMSDPSALAPFPNAIVFNWATIFVLAFGNLGALDFQARCMASKTPKVARLGCLIAGCLTFVIGIPFSYLGAIVRTHYGPDSARAHFEADTCAVQLGLPTCGLWVPDPDAFIKLLTHEAPKFLGAWALVGIVAASMSTCDGAILAMGTVFSHNIVRNFGGCVTNKNLLTIARIASVPLSCAAAVIAAYYRSNHSLGATGYLLIVAFDIVLATVVVPLFGCFYTKKPSPLAAICSILAGVITRVVLEFTLPKDGFLLAPFPGDEFLNYGPAASSKFPTFFDLPEEDLWDPSTEPCDQERYNDYSGVDSLVAPLASLVFFVFFQFLERNGPLIEFAEGGVMSPYLKDGQVTDEDTEPAKDDLGISRTGKDAEEGGSAAE